MRQEAKLIDVTRTFVPVDPNAFPNTQHTSNREEGPEARIPAMAYKGYNFLPTAHGYKSYFGTNQNINIDDLDHRADWIFLFQNIAYENVLVALCEDGIWVKDGAVVGAWTQLVSIIPDVDPDVHYDWTFTVIENDIYCYMQGKSSYYKLTSSLTTPFIAVTTVTPTFLNMSGQVGIFRAGGRLGFWDSDNSFAWSADDDFSDFVPSTTTLAGNAKFLDLVGKIVTVLPHGDGFIIYATKSVLYIVSAPEKAFQWEPYVIYSNAGIAYPRQACIGHPDTTHFAWTSIGLVKIEGGKGEPLVPEITDYLASEQSPVYLDIMEGRYLFLSVMNADFISGEVQVTEEVIDAVDYVFPGSTSTVSDFVEGQTLTGSSACTAIAANTAGLFSAPSPVDMKPGTRPSPVWKCYMDVDIGEVGNITFDNTPVATIDPAGVEKNHCPEGTNTMADINTTTVGKTVVEGVFNSMEAFISTQMAIWEWQDQNREAILSEIQKASYGSATTYNASPQTANPLVVTEAYIDSYPAAFGPVEFDYNTCSFWLMRTCTKAYELWRRKQNSSTVQDAAVSMGPLTDGYGHTNNYRMDTRGWGATEAEALSNSYSSLAFDGWVPFLPWTITPRSGASAAAYLAVPTGSGTWSKIFAVSDVFASNGANMGQIYRYTGLAQSTHTAMDNPSGDNTLAQALAGTDYLKYPTAGRYTETEEMYAVNVLKEADLAADDVQAAFCEIVGWTYTKNDNTQGTVVASSCNISTPPTSNQDVHDARPRPPIAKNGSLCGIPFTPITIPGSPAVDVTWPETVVTIPAGSFFLQQGSPAPIYPTLEGALVYDLQLKKWGKMYGSFKHLLNYSPINTQARGVVPYQSFGIMGGVLKGNGKIYLFDAYPTDSWITYGKIGYYRLGMTSCEEVFVQFASLSSGTLEVHSSITGRDLAAGYDKITAFMDAGHAHLTGGPVGRWHNVTIRGIYDISYLEFRGFRQGRR